VRREEFDLDPVARDQQADLEGPAGRIGERARKGLLDGGGDLLSLIRGGA